jgi:YHS domain-containing protein
VAVDPLSVTATAPQDGDEIAPDPEIEEGEVGNPLLIPGPKSIHQFGNSLKFCPVTRKEKKMLVYGDPALCLSFDGKKYLFASQDALDAFKVNPYRYVFDPRAFIPPPRLWMLGVPFSGRRSTAAKLSEQYAVPLFYYDETYFVELMAAASGSGDVVRGLSVPSDPENPYVKRALALAKELKNFDEDQSKKMALKEKTQREQAKRDELRDAGEEVDDLDEEEEAEIQKALEFEPEEAEAREERVGKTYRQICAALMRIEPFESCGYIMVGRPSSESELQTFLDEGAFPEAVIHMKLSAESYVGRQIDDEFQRRRTESEAKQIAVTAKRKELQMKQRLAELERWRRRNIGGEDTGAAEEDSEPLEDVEQVTVDGVRADLEASFETANGSVTAVIGALPERRITVIDVNCDIGVDAVWSSVVDQTAHILRNRRSLLEAPQVITYDDAQVLLRRGAKVLSSFRFEDPVALYEQREGRKRALKTLPPKKTITPEELTIDPAVQGGAGDGHGQKQKRLVTRVNDDGEEVEVEEEIDEEAPAEEAQEPEEEELEAEPEISPEELEDMRREHNEKVKAQQDKLKPRAAILGNRIFFFNGNESLLKFIYNPLKFWDQPPPLPVLPGPVVVVFEEPPIETNGKLQRSMGEQIAYNLGSVFADLPKLLKWAALCDGLGPLSVKARGALISGEPIDLIQLRNISVERVLSADAQHHGVVMLNIPRTDGCVDFFASRGLYMSKVLCFNKHLWTTAQRIAQLADVVHEIHSTSHTIAAYTEAIGTVLRHISRQKSLVLCRDLGFPAAVYETLSLSAEIAANRSAFQWYCPYMWLHHEQLVDLREKREFSAYYCGKYYCFSSQQFLLQFLEHPEAVSGELEQGDLKLNIPSVLPRQLTAEEATGRSFALGGCCPVTLYRSRTNVGLRGVCEPTAVLGDKAYHAVEYDGQFYAMVDNDATVSFLRQPWLFAKGATLPAAHKMPYDSSTLNGVPHEVYVTYKLHESVAKAMLAVCRDRPKYPGLSIEESALKYLALHLKAENPANTEVREKQYKANFAKFTRHSTLYKTISTTEPESESEKREFHERCDAWDRIQDHPTEHEAYIHLVENHNSI